MMKMRTTILLFFTFFLTTFTHSQTIKKINQGSWIGKLDIGNNQVLPFNMVLKKSKKTLALEIINGKEIVPMNTPIQIGDSIHIGFSNFNTELIFKIHGSDSLNGVWLNKNKANYSIPFSASYSSENRFKQTTNTSSADLSGKWKTTFAPNTTDEYPALGVFEQKNTYLTGTFLTETGDYRFLEGNVYGNELYLSCFDGSHAFLFTAVRNEKNELSGTFFSGKHWSCSWNAINDPNYELTNPDSLTYLVEDIQNLEFSSTDLNGKPFNFPTEQYKNKVVIIQILGTWCPNCMDETEYFKDLYNKYHDKGLEIIGIGYEIGTDQEAHIERLEAYKQRFNLEYKLLVGGTASKEVSSELFPMLNSIQSYPTTIFLDRKGNIVRIHTGFNGPSTGQYYTDYMHKTEKLIESLIKD